MSVSVTFVVDGLPPSENHALCRARNGRMFPSKEYRRWKHTVSKLKNKSIQPSIWYCVSRQFYFPVRYKNGNIKKKDVSNLNKYADDELCKKLGIDDSYIIKGVEEKIDCNPGEEKTVWTIMCVD